MSFDTSLVVGFVILTLVIGLGHGQRVKTIKDYALGGRNFTTAALVATIVATWASSSGFFVTLSKTYSDGFYYIFARCGIGVYFLIVAFLLVPRMGEFLGKTSISEAMGDLYGQKVRVITAIAGTIGSAGTIAVQFKVFGGLFSYFLHLPSHISIISAGLITTIYSAFGGIRAVTFTDVLQFFAFGIIIPLVGLIVWSDFFDANYTLTEAFSIPRFDMTNNTNAELLVMGLTFLYFAIPAMSPSAFQRIAIGKNIDQVKKAFCIASIFIILIQIMSASIPFLIYSLNPDLDANNLLNYIIEHYSYPGLKGFILIVIIAFAMSTADSRLNSSAVLFTNDIYSVFIKKVKNEIFVTRLFAFILGIVAISLSLVEKDLLGIVVLANSFFHPIVTPVMLFTIFGFRSSSKSVLIGITAGFIVTMVWKILPVSSDISWKLMGLLFAMFCNGFFLILSHYILKQPGGWVGIKDKTYLNKQKVKRLESQKKLIKWFYNFTFNGFIKRIAPNSDFTYTTMGIYFVIYSITTMYSTHLELKGINSSLITTIYQVMLISGTVMGMYQIWPLSISYKIKETIVRIWWPIAAFYMLIFLSCFFVLVSEFHMIQVALFVLNLVIASMLFGWRVSLVLIPIGCYLSVEFYKFYFGLEKFQMGFGSPEFILIYIMLIICIALLVFLKPKQEHQEATEEKADHFEKKTTTLEKEVDYAKREFENLAQGIGFLEDQFKLKKGKLKEKELYLRDQLKLMRIEVRKIQEMKDEFIRNVPHESNTPMTAILSSSEVLYSYYDKLDKGNIKKTLKDIINGGERLKSYINNIADLSKLSSLSYDLDLKEVNLSELVKKRPSVYKKVFLDDATKQEFKFNIDKNIIVECDEYYITQAIDNLISNAVMYGQGHPVTISLTKTTDNKVEFKITDSGIGIPKDELYSIFDKFAVSSKTQTPAEGRGVGLALCEKIIKEHNGKIWVESDGNTGSIFYFTIPIK